MNASALPLLYHADGSIQSANPIRPPLSAYYPPDRHELWRQIGECIEQSEHYMLPNDTLMMFQISPATCSSPATACYRVGNSVPLAQHPPYIFLVPHGAFCDSGPLMVKACQVLKAALKSGNNNNFGGGGNKPKTFLFIGTDHSSYKGPPTYLSSQTWRTPLGDIQKDDDLFRCFLESGMTPIDDDSHMREHSIENMIPFVQYFFADDSDLQMVAINCRRQSTTKNHNKVYKEQGQRIATIVRDYLQRTNQARTVIIMATTDYTHAGPWYGELPRNLGQTIPDYIRHKDEPVLRAIRQMGVRATYQTGRCTSMCGLGTTLVTMKIAHDFGKHRAIQLQYAVGSDICNRGLDDQTGFASFVFV